MLLPIKPNDPWQRLPGGLRGRPLANYNHGKEYFHKTLHTMEIKIESIAKPTTAWVVIPTLTLLPAITPWWSNKLGIVK